MQLAYEANQTKSCAISIQGKPRLSPVLTSIRDKPSQIKKIEKEKKSKKKKSKIRKEKIEKSKKFEKLKKIKREKEKKFVFSPGQNMRLLSLPYF